MEINNYDIVAPVIDRKKPFYYEKRRSLICRFRQRYTYYLEGSRYNQNTKTKDYYLFVGKIKFHDSCNKINNDDYGRAIMRLHSDFHDYVRDECYARGNINVTFVETEDNYDVYRVE